MILSLSNLHSGYKDIPIIQDVSFELEEGGILSIIGRNGVGKTTLIKTIIGLLKLTSGSIFLREEDITNLSADRRARRGIGYVPQGKEIFSRLTVEENVRMGELINENKKEKDYEFIYEYFPVLKERKTQKAGTLSGGEQQMLTIGRVLVGDPDLLLLDEPSEGLQPTIVQQITETIQRLNKEEGTSILIVEQNLGLVSRIARDCYVMDKGRIVRNLTSEELSDVEVMREYLAV